MTELITLINQEIPEGRQSLQDSFTNLERVAEYCETNYYQSDNKRMALEETKNYTTQSLASVAYQINTLAYNFLQMLDLQTTQLAEMESNINHISQMTMIHKEKVARREIGILTTNKSTTRQHKIAAPPNPERPIKYIRKPIDYSILDDIGHGIKTTNNTPRSKRPGGQSTPPLNGQSGPPPTTKPPTPPQPVRGMGSLSKGSREYRALAPPVAPPQVPSNYAPNYPVGHPRAPESRRDRGSGYGSLPMMPSQMAVPPPAPPQIGMVHPITHSLHRHHPHEIPPSPTPPPPPPEVVNMVMSNYGTTASPSLPPPPLDIPAEECETEGHISPPLPPPPDDDHAMFMASYPPPTQHAYGHSHEMQIPEWVPKNYLEKVIAIYDYAADKDDELSFAENSVIYVIKKNDDGWYEGIMDGVTGLFPGNYVEHCI